MTEEITLAALPPVPVFLTQGRATTTSREIAEFFGKEHRNVVRDIERLGCSDEFNALNFEQIEYFDARNRPQRMYRLTRDGFTFLAMGFTGPRAAQFKEAFITAFNQMEDQLRGGSLMPMLAETVSRMQLQIESVLERQAQDTQKLSAVLDLVDVTKRYVGLLEDNQKRAKPAKKLTPEIVAEVLELLAQGMNKPSISRHMEISLTTVQRISRGETLGMTAELRKAWQEENMRKANELLARMKDSGGDHGNTH